MWQGEDSTHTLCDKKEAEQFLLEKMSGGYHDVPSENEIATAKEYGIDLETETA
jgi:hypothetical protein